MNMQHPTIQKEQVDQTYSIIKEQLEPLLTNLEKALTGLLSPKRCNEILSFLQTDQTPLGFSGGVWSPEQVSERLIEIILCMAKFKENDMETVKLFLQGAVEYAEYLYARNSGNRIKASLGLAFAGVTLNNLMLSDMWKLAGFSRFATEYARAPSILEEEGIRERFTAIVDLAVENEIPILQPAMGIYEKATGKVIEYSYEAHFKLSDEEYFDQINLDFPGLEDVKKAVLNGEIEKAKRAYVNYLAILRASQEYFNPWHYDVVDMHEADEICQNILFLRAHNALKHDYGKEVDWTTVLNNDIETNVSINGHSTFG